MEPAGVGVGWQRGERLEPQAVEHAQHLRAPTRGRARPRGDVQLERAVGVAEADEVTRARERTRSSRARRGAGRSAPVVAGSRGGAVRATDRRRGGGTRTGRRARRPAACPRRAVGPAGAAAPRRIGREQQALGGFGRGPDRRLNDVPVLPARHRDARVRDGHAAGLRAAPPRGSSRGRRPRGARSSIAWLVYGAGSVRRSRRSAAPLHPAGRPGVPAGAELVGDVRDRGHAPASVGRKNSHWSASGHGSSSRPAVGRPRGRAEAAGAGEQRALGEVAPRCRRARARRGEAGPSSVGSQARRGAATSAADVHDEQSRGIARDDTRRPRAVEELEAAPGHDEQALAARRPRQRARACNLRSATVAVRESTATTLTRPRAST